jgi:hypothetical protein
VLSGAGGERFVMKIDLALYLNGALVYPRATIEVSAQVKGLPAEGKQADTIADKPDRSTPVVPMGSSVLAPGLGAAYPF